MLSLETLACLWEKYPDAARARVQEFTLDGRRFEFNRRPALMGVINLSPDSWYRESVALTVEAAVRRGKLLQTQGADLVDVGAESTLAQAERVEAAVQQSKLLPVVRGLREAGVLVSVETYHSEVARVCLEAGARVINLTGSAEGERIYRLAAAHQAAVIICYVQGPHVRAVGDYAFAEDPIAPMLDYFTQEIERARACGVDKLIIDPGLGFYYANLQDSSRRVQHQMQVFLHTFRLRTLGVPVCHALPHAFEFFGEEVRCAEPFFAVLAALGRTDVLRTHELPRVKAVLDTLAVYPDAKASEQTP